MNVALCSLNVSYIHKNLALRWLYVSKPAQLNARIIEGTVQAVDRCIDELLNYQLDVLGLSCFIFNVDATRELIQKIKVRKPDVKIYLGGPEATYNDERFWDLPIEGILKGEAEFSFWDAIQNHATTGFQSSKDERVEPLRTDLKRLEDLESPYFLDFDEADRLKRYLYVETSRGCPYGCTYCMASLDRKVRRFSMPYLQRFFETLKTHPVHQVKFLDRTFNLEPTRALELAQACVSVPKPTTFHMELVGDQLDENLLQFFVDHVDRFRMEIGVQSFHVKTLEAVGRPCNLTRLKTTIQRLSEVKAHQHTDLIAGLPYEDLDRFKVSLSELVQLKPMEIQCGILKLLRGTAIYYERDGYGYTFSKEAPYPVLSNRWMSEADLKRVESCALGIEKCYNSGRLREPLQSFCIQNPSIAFDVFEACGQALQSLSHPYSTKAFYLAIYEGLKPYSGEAKDWVQKAYYAQERLRPSRLFENEMLVLGKRMVERIEQDYPRLKPLWIKSLDHQLIAYLYPGDFTQVYTFSAQGELLSHETHHRHA